MSVTVKGVVGRQPAGGHLPDDPAESRPPTSQPTVRARRRSVLRLLPRARTSVRPRGRHLPPPAPGCVQRDPEPVGFVMTAMVRRARRPRQADPDRVEEARERGRRADVWTTNGDDDRRRYGPEDWTASPLGVWTAKDLLGHLGAFEVRARCPRDTVDAPLLEILMAGPRRSTTSKANARDFRRRYRRVRDRTSGSSCPSAPIDRWREGTIPWYGPQTTR